MKWFSVLILSLAMLGSVQAATPDDQYIEIYNLIQQADGFNQSEVRQAVEKYSQARNALLKLQKSHPNWNPDVVLFRLEYVTEKLNNANKQLSLAAAPAVVTPITKAPASKKAALIELQQEIAQLTNEVHMLVAERNALEKRLKEALSVQPASTDPLELAKAQQEIIALKKDRDLLQLTLDQSKGAIQPDTNTNTEVVKERDTLKTDLADANKTVEQLKAQLQEASAGSKDLKAAQQALQNAEKEKARLESDCADLKEKLSKAGSKKSDNKQNAEIVELKAKLSQNASEAKDLKDAREALQDVQKEKEKLERDCADLKGKLSKAGDKKTRKADAKADKLDAEIVDLKAQLSIATADAKELKNTHEKLVDAQKANKKLETELAELKVRAKAAAAVPAPAPAPVVSTPNVQAKAEVKVSRPWYSRLNPFSSSKKSAAKPPKAKNTDAKTIAELRARVKVLEAQPISYTSEELAVIKTASVKPMLAPVPAAETTSTTPTNAAPKIRSFKDLPPGTGALMADAERSFMAGKYDVAEKRYQDVLHQDEQNVYVLSHLASAQYFANHLDACEKTLKTALALDPNDAYSLFTMGNLRLRQNNADEALTLLSHAVSINETNSAMQNSLGMALSRKGLTKQAESALRKAIQLDPNFPEAHQNLAIVYATQKPPFIELSRWHYKKSLDMGQPKNAELEKILEKETAAAAKAADKPADKPEK